MKGLRAAHELAERSFKVHVYERKPVLGGRRQASRHPTPGTMDASCLLPIPVGRVKSTACADALTACPGAMMGLSVIPILLSMFAAVRVYFQTRTNLAVCHASAGSTIGTLGNRLHSVRCHRSSRRFRNLTFDSGG